jgi:hypothetical protein
LLSLYTYNTGEFSKVEHLEQTNKMVTTMEKASLQKEQFGVAFLLKTPMKGTLPILALVF